MFTTEWKFGMLDFGEVKGIRAAVFSKVPEKDEFDFFDGIAAHVLVRHEGIPAATARIYPDEGSTRIDRFAVLSEFSNFGYYELMLRLMLFKAEELAGNEIIARLSDEDTMVPTFIKFGFVPKGDAIIERGGTYYDFYVAKDSVKWFSMCGEHK